MTKELHNLKIKLWRLYEKNKRTRNPLRSG